MDAIRVVVVTEWEILCRLAQLRPIGQTALKYGIEIDAFTWIAPVRGSNVVYIWHAPAIAFDDSVVYQLDDPYNPIDDGNTYDA